jgi:AcrR family transcriptional regulator
MSVLDDPQQRLLQAAGEVFGEKGYQAATVREICERGNVNLAAVNYYFGAKEKLYHEVLRESCQCTVRAMPLQGPDGSHSPAEQLRLFIEQMVERVVIDPAQHPTWHSQLMMREMSQPSEFGRQIIQEFIRPVYERLWRILAELVPPGFPRDRLHLIAFSIVGQCLYHRIARHVILSVVGPEEHRTYTAAVLGEHIARFSLAALGLTPPILEPEPRT